MPDRSDMPAATETITRAELHSALETVVDRLLATVATKDDLARVEATMATKDDLARVEATMATQEDVARHARAIMEAGAAQIAVLDDKYRDLPGRVGQLETTVYKRTKRAKPKPSRSPAPRRR